MWKNPARWALWKNKGISTCNPYASQEVMGHVTKTELTLIHVDVPLSSPKKGIIRKPNRERHMPAKLIGDGEEMYIVGPTKVDWRRLKL